MNLNLFKKDENLSVLILCGGVGQRLRPLTKTIPKPLVKIKDRSMLEYIINHFLKYNINNITIATGYKHFLIKKFINKKYPNKNIKVINTGPNTEIIDRIKRVSNNLNNNIILCYGDTLVDINLNKLILYFKQNIKKFIISSYELKSTFGILDLKDDNNVKKFKEKPKLGIWFNVGYFIFSKDIIKNIGKFKKFKIFLSSLANKNKMKAFKHKGKHITVNTISELEDAKIQIDKFA